MNIVLVTLLFASLVATVVGFIKPKAFEFVFKGRAQRTFCSGLFALLSVIIFVLIGVLNLGDNNAKVITKPTTDQDVLYGRLFEGALADTATKYAEAQVYADAWLRANPSEISRDEWLKLGDAVKSKWQAAEAASQNLDAVAAAMPNYAEPKLSSGSNWLFPKAYALDPSYREFYKHRDAIAKDEEYMKKLNAIDVAPAFQKVKTTAKLFNTDVYRAKAIVDNFYSQVATNSVDYANMSGQAAVASQAIATGSNIALFVAGLSTGASELALLGSAQKLVNAVNIITTSIAGANLTFNIVEEGADLGLFSAETGAAFSKAKDAKFLQYANTLISIKDLSKALSNFSDIKKVLSDASGKLTLDSIKKFMGKSDEVKKVADNLKENGIGNLQTLYDWTSWAGDQTTDIAKVLQTPGDSSIGLDGAQPSQINQSLPMVKLDANGIAFALIAQTVPGLFTPYNAMAAGDQPVGTDSQEQAANQQTEPTEDYNGTYSGSDSVSDGIANARITVSGSSLSGSGSYKQSFESSSFRMGLSISGSLREDGRVSGSVSGSGTYGERTYSVSGSFSGYISNGSMKLSYRASGSAGSGSGNISLYK